MADDAGGEGGSTRITDEVFMMECLKNATTPVVVSCSLISARLRLHMVSSINLIIIG